MISLKTQGRLGVESGLEHHALTTWLRAASLQSCLFTEPQPQVSVISVCLSFLAGQIEGKIRVFSIHLCWWVFFFSSCIYFICRLNQTPSQSNAPPSLGNVHTSGDLAALGAESHLPGFCSVEQKQILHQATSNFPILE